MEEESKITAQNKFLSISDGVFTLAETENKKVFYFYRNDGNVLNNPYSKPMELFHKYMAMKMMNCEIKEIIMKDICLQMSDDKKIIRLSLCDIGKKNNMPQKSPSFFKRIVNKIFG